MPTFADEIRNDPVLFALLERFTPRLAGGPLPGSDKQTYAVARDGRLLIIVRPEGAQPSPLSVVLNWKMPR